MTEKILSVLEKQQIGEYLLLEVQKETVELFFCEKGSEHETGGTCAYLPGHGLPGL